MKVSLARSAQIDLIEIWNWNAEKRGVSSADKYLEFLVRNIEKLEKTYLRGRAVRSRPELKYIVLRKGTKGHGHLAIYRIDLHQVVVLHLFHTAQDWEGKLAEDR